MSDKDHLSLASIVGNRSLRYISIVVQFLSRGTDFVFIVQQDKYNKDGINA